VRALHITLLLLLAAPLGGCGDDPLPAGSLFVRAPDALFEEHGRLAPIDGHGFGDGGEGAWYADVEDGLAWSRGRRAQLILNTLDDGRGRVLRVRAKRAPGGAKELTVRLGEHVLDTVDLSEGSAWHEFHTPAEIWDGGENLLELSVASTVVVPAPRGYDIADERRVGFALGVVEWAEPRLAHASREGLELEPGTGALYHLSGPNAGRLVLSGHVPDGVDGALALTFGSLDTTDSRVLIDAEPVVVLPVNGVVAWEGSLPERSRAFADATGSLRLEWSGDGAVVIDDLRALPLDAARPKESDGPTRPNVVFVSVDTLAAKHLSCYGYPRETSPHIDRFAAESVLFEAAMANAPWTAPSYLSQFTGLYPNAHEIRAQGVAEPQAWETNNLAASRWTWAEALRSAGYATAAWLDNPWVSAGMGMDQGFDVFDTSAAEIYLSDTDGGFAHILPLALEWMAQRESPFFALLQPMDPHGPYFTRWRYRGRWDGDGLYDPERRVPVGFDQLHVFGVIPEYVAWAERKGIGPPTETLRSEPYANAYDEKIAEVDDYFGDLYAWLDRRGLLENSIVILSSDHGEAVGEHDYWFDHGTLYDEVLRVPLIVRLPGGEHGGRRISTPVQLVDLMPTVLELAGLPVPPDLHGRSLAAAIGGAALEAVPIFARGGIGDQEAVLDGGDKLIWSVPTSSSFQTILRHPRMPEGHLERTAPELVGTWWSTAKYATWFAERPEVKRAVFEPLVGEFREVYRWRDDPLELNDLVGPSAQAPDVATRERLEGVRLAERAKGEDARASASRAVRPPSISSAVRERLEALGYLEAGEGAPTGSDGR
jgi:arylsulfatase A-like enzyme